MVMALFATTNVLLLCSAVALLVVADTRDAFVGRPRNHGRSHRRRCRGHDETRLPMASYSDGFLSQFHDTSQKEKQLVTNALARLHNQERQDEQQVKEWQESFNRNGLADFVPPVSDGMNCLLVGEKDAEDEGSLLNGFAEHQQPQKENTSSGPMMMILPWELEAQAQITALRLLGAGEDACDPDEKDDDSIRTEIVFTPNNADDSQMVHAPSSATSSQQRDPEYDCIVDRGLMNALLKLSGGDATVATVQDLLHEATAALREHGIYVITTQQALSREQKQQLERGSPGLEWQFELDGISDTQTVVSVGRRYCTESMPSVGRLSPRRGYFQY